MDQKPTWFEQVLALSIGHEQLAGIVKALSVKIDHLEEANRKEHDTSEKTVDRKETLRALIISSIISAIVAGVIGYYLHH